MTTKLTKKKIVHEGEKEASMHISEQGKGRRD